jgi:D-3-phosphoglycerate dehydrogenase/C-terminal binding protein
MKSKVIITDFLNDDLAPEREIFGDLAEVVALNAFTEDELAGQIDDADAVLLYHYLGLSAKTIDRLTKCRIIVRCGVGFDNVDRAAARAKGIPVANVPDYGTEDVADSAIGMMLSLTRGIHFLNSRLRRNEGNWAHDQAAPLYRLRGRTLGIIGMGRIGTATALRAKALGMDVVYHDPYAPQGRDKSLGIRWVETVEELLKQSFVVSPHCPLSPETKHLINDRTLTLMPQGSYLVNTSRGGVVDVLAVLRALENEHLSGAGIDVLETEPPLPDHPLIRAWRDSGHPAYDRLILNPHSAFYCEEGLMDMRVKGAQNVRRVLEGKEPFNVVN